MVRPGAAGQPVFGQPASPAQDVARQNLRGILALLASAAAFMCNDALTKLNLAELPLGEIMFLRNAVASILCLHMCAIMGLGRPIRVVLCGPVVLRCLGEMTTTICYLTALARMPLANMTFLMQSSPLVLTAVSAMLLGERIGWRRWTATGFGFLGVLLIIRPGTSAFNMATLLALAAVCAGVLRDLSTRRIPAGLPSLMVTLASSTMIMAAGLALGASEIWVTPSPIAWMRLLASSGFICLALYFGVTAMRLGELSVIAPFRFSSVIFALLASWAIWHQIPDAPSLTGATIVVAAGLYSLHREHLRRRGLT